MSPFPCAGWPFTCPRSKLHFRLCLIGWSACLPLSSKSSLCVSMTSPFSVTWFCRHFPPFSRLLFLFDHFFCSAEAFYFDAVPLTYFCFCWCFCCQKCFLLAYFSRRILVTHLSGLLTRKSSGLPQITVAARHVAAGHTDPGLKARNRFPCL